jgi:hypothetical protein
MFVGICAAILAITIVSDSSTRGVPCRAIQYLPLIGGPFWFPTSGETELSEMSFREGSVAEASFNNQKSFPIEQIVIRDSCVGIGKTRQLQVMPFFRFGKWPDSDPYSYRTRGHVYFFTNFIRTDCPSGFWRVLQKNGIKPHIFGLPYGQIQGWFFADIDVTEIDEERLSESGFADMRFPCNDPSASIDDYSVPGDFVAINDQSRLPIGDFPSINHQIVGQVSQSFGLVSGNTRHSEGKNEEYQIYPFESAVFFGLGIFIGTFGIFLAIIVAPTRGDVWGFAGLALIPVGLIICYFSAGFFATHLISP